MEEQEHRHPHAFMGDFVEKYELIRPSLEKGYVDSVAFIIGDLVARATVCEEDLQKMATPNREAYKRYRVALIYLDGLVKNPKERSLVETKFPLIDRRVSELQMILSKDQIYLSQRGSLTEVQE